MLLKREENLRIEINVGIKRKGIQKPIILDFRRCNFES